MIGGQRQGDDEREALNSARAVLAHVLFHRHRHAGDVEALLLGLDPDDGRHAGRHPARPVGVRGPPGRCPPAGPAPVYGKPRPPAGPVLCPVFPIFQETRTS